MANAIYLYRLTHDTGLAPCVTDELLTLACCKGGWKTGVKTGLRYFVGEKRDADYEQDNLYIAGLFKNKLLYFAKITDVLPMKEHYTDKGYSNRKDFIYTVDKKTGELKRNGKQPGVHEENELIERDKAGVYVLLSEDFAYWGSEASEELLKPIKNAFPKTRGEKFYSGREATKIVDYLRSLKKRGKLADPTQKLSGRKCGGCGQL